MFVVCHSERGTVELDGKKCNLAPTAVASCIRSMVQIVSMPESSHEIGCSSSRLQKPKLFIYFKMWTCLTERKCLLQNIQIN